MTTTTYTHFQFTRHKCVIKLLTIHHLIAIPQWISFTWLSILTVSMTDKVLLHNASVHNINCAHFSLSTNLYICANIRTYVCTYLRTCVYSTHICTYVHRLYMYVLVVCGYIHTFIVCTFTTLGAVKL